MSCSADVTPPPTPSPTASNKATEVESNVTDQTKDESWFSRLFGGSSNDTKQTQAKSGFKPIVTDFNSPSHGIRVKPKVIKSGRTIR